MIHYVRRLNGRNARRSALYSIYGRFGGAAARGGIGEIPNDPALGISPIPPWGTLQEASYRGPVKAGFWSLSAQAPQNPYPGAPAASCECLAVSEVSLRAGGPPERLAHHYRAPGNNK